MTKTGTVYLKVRIRLNQDVTEEEAQELVDNMYYEFKDDNDLIADTEIVANGISPYDV